MAAASVVFYTICLLSLICADINNDYSPRDVYLSNSGLHHRQKRFAGWEQDTSKVALNQAEIFELIAAHNARRREVHPDGHSATNMIFLIWDENLSVVAQNWANGCDFDHNYDNAYGENLSAQPSYYNVTSMVDGWYSEGNSYTYSSHSCSTSTCGHYHQVVLAESRYFGCGMKFCPTVTTATMSNTYLLVCNYDPAENKGSSVPYESGTTCSNCPTAYPDCENSLCRSNPICDGLVCGNGGTLVSELCWCDGDTGTDNENPTTATSNNDNPTTAPSNNENPTTTTSNTGASESGAWRYAGHHFCYVMLAIMIRLCM